jgi:hypothetical protein
VLSFCDTASGSIVGIEVDETNAENREGVVMVDERRVIVLCILSIRFFSAILKNLKRLTSSQ